MANKSLGLVSTVNRPARKIALTPNASRFQDLWDRCALANREPDTVATFDQLVEAYAEDGREYHTLAHIEHCLAQLDLVRADAAETGSYGPQTLDIVEFGIWYHDIIYRPSASDNEARSAALFVDLSTELIKPRIIDDVHRLIMATLHLAKPAREDEGLMVDIDLSSFGMEWQDFRRDSVNVRKEMSHLSEREFAASHQRFLYTLLDRDSIYTTSFFRDRYEHRARQNIRRYIDDFLKF